MISVPLFQTVVFVLDFANYTVRDVDVVHSVRMNSPEMTPTFFRNGTIWQHTLDQWTSFETH